MWITATGLWRCMRLPLLLLLAVVLLVSMARGLIWPLCFVFGGHRAVARMPVHDKLPVVEPLACESRF